ncbi:MAG: hypothetical protein A2509_00260 [Candidatus Edwardsbacteria bacterium RIFOXYD12_FULL_50_11]|uniref:Glycosyltransferase RgtA/B/C/D-like domain-containing protein n=1 Tax=Candidatus Edwardsbacteria bacterium GWF2_54_11 TaxID=1817851 RepID=A0A1F5RHK6_9BACT|nr:MAG: hypothetical protein A2502_00865 [Candidatus Edwardsbacteria bacterium RifOxyC12_full_54_24]OGF06148.1 MAG: hypothetical protein A2273_11315 [Candidatus Edwardsbacteria bacterium RifOxyA12_full_54_48]OGF12585.1 MAG: hypothetical protein A3K15_01955 [Candidatus Edwardsbacteria bacterium GWE2_54_12]OGF13878.1 MAG: hypothetical protein A2024_10555 [Candidatus Edwardsbacteria bacterium GWF2_54_11]OGF17576.1 MAG: hypothetical protein A2509_00260 [Candidatus Edwardsbacteria bacterium RIFOXYD1
MKKQYLQISLILLLTVLVYLPALKAGFMYDDRFFVQENTKIRDWKYVGEYFTNSGRSIASIFWDGIWRPLRTITYLVDYQVWGLNPFGFHLTSLLWHLANIILLYFLLGRLFKDKRLQLTAGLIFALHPVQTEAVTWISSRGDLMYVTFGLLMFIWHHRYRENKRIYLLGLSLLSLTLALLSKETAVVFPLLVMLYDWLFENRGKIRPFLAGWKTYLPYLALLAVYLITRRLALGRVSQCPYWGDSIWTTVFTMLRAALDYVRLLFLPLWLRVDYGYDLSTSLLDWRVLGSLAILTIISLLAVRDIKGSRFLAFGWLWLVVGLLPVSNLLPLTALLAERFLYLPVIGFAVWAGFLLGGIRSQKIFQMVMITLILLMAGLSIRRNIEWQEPLKFWRTETERSPNSYIAHGNLGNILFLNEDMPGAEREYRRAVELDPTYDNALSGLAITCAQLQKYQEGESYAQKCLALNPGNTNALLTAGICRAAGDDLDSAEIYFSRVTNAEPENEKGWINLGIVRQKQGDWDKAMACFDRALAIQPRDYFLYNEMGAIWARKGELDKAAALWQRSLSLDPDFLPARMNLALILEKSDPALAAKHWEIFLQRAAAQGQSVNEAFVRKRIAELNEKIRK